MSVLHPRLRLPSLRPSRACAFGQPVPTTGSAALGSRPAQGTQVLYRGKCTGESNRDDRAGPKCRGGVPWRTMVVVRQSFQVETIAVDEVNRNQTGCGRNRSVAGSSGPVAKAFRTRRRASEDRWHGGGHERSGDGEGRAPPVFQPSNGEVTQSNEPRTNPGRFKSG